MKDYYGNADKIAASLKKLAVKHFYDFGNRITQFDEIHKMKAAKELYKELFDEVKVAFLRLAKSYYRKITSDWLDDYLLEYNPVTKYVFEHEVERKEGRLAEAVIASITPKDELETALRLWVNMITQYTIDIADRATIDRLKSEGVKEVMWVTEGDEKVCSVCNKRGGNVYDIDKVPPKPHLNCRCWVVKV